jgi:4-nitrophenyl phosphatase
MNKDPADNTLEPFTFANYTHDPEVGAVLCGLDLAINYTKLCKAFQYLTRNQDCLFLATNGDSTYPVSGGTLPGTGALWSTLRVALNKDPISIGKPASTMLDCIKAKCV